MHRDKSILVFLVIINMLLVISATNHWLLTKDGKIQPQVDSPYYLQRPDDLIAFLNQSKYQQMIDSLYAELVLIKTDLRSKMNHVDSYTKDFMYQTKCIVHYFLRESDLFSSVSSKTYLNRIYSRSYDYRSATKDNLIPRCTDFLPLSYSMFSFDHLESIMNRKNLSMDAEEALKLQELELTNPRLANILATGLKHDPKSWRFHTLSTLYWRLKGNALEAIECARRGVHLAPRKHKDIPLLSLGTILQRTKQPNDAVIVFGAAVDHAPDIPENQFAHANALVLISEFNKSLAFYEAAKSLDPSYATKVDYIKNSMICFKYIKTRLLKMEGVLDEMASEVKKYEERKKLLVEFLSKLLQEQVPYWDRLVDEKSNDVASKNNLLQRGQYCSTRFSAGSDEPILFCDFISDIQMKLETKDISVDLINTYLEHANELIQTHMSSIGVFEHLNVNNISEGDIADVFNESDKKLP